MKPARVVNCPNCGGQVEFKAGTSLLSVCPFCTSAVARVGGDITELEILGQVAPLADLGSPLAVGTSGKHEGKSFTIVGRVQLDYGAGPWNEWYAAFDDDRWAWIAEAQGRLYVTFGQEVSGLPSYPSARVGSRFKIGQATFAVVERRRARFVSGEGELPFAVEPKAEFFYCDLEGPDGTFGTIDYGQGHEPEMLFLGVERRYDDLFDKSVLRNQEASKVDVSVGMNCPNCGAAVALRAPDDAQRVVCDSCESLLDCSKGSELYLLTAARQRGPDPKIPLGSTGKIDGAPYTVYGMLTRSVTFDGVRYAWQEYLLHEDRRGGYFWLIESDNHWTFVSPVSAGSVSEMGGVARHDKKAYRHFQSASAHVDALRGEFYWKVAVGDTVGTADYVKPPFILSRELSADEVSWSAGRYVEPEEIQDTFGLKQKLGRPRGVAPHQPNPRGPSLKASWLFAVGFTVLLFALAGLMMVTSDNTIVLNQDWSLPSKTRGGNEKPRRVKGDLLRSAPFEISGQSAVELTVASDVQNGFVFADGTLVDQTNQKRIPFGAHVRKFGGYAGGATWSQGARRRTVYLGAVPSGRYVLEVTPEWTTGTGEPRKLGVTIRSDVFIGTHAMVVFFLIWFFPLFQSMRYFGFEKTRWAESDHSMS